MKANAETAGKTANEESVGYSETADAITITIKGQALANLRTIAAAINSVEWCDNDNCALTVLDGFVVGDILYNLGQPTEGSLGISAGGVGELCDLILSGIDTGFEDGSPEDRERKAALERAFANAGL